MQSGTDQFGYGLMTTSERMPVLPTRQVVPDPETTEGQKQALAQTPLEPLD
jgi:hypothetical protein